jgi:uncharacterized protein YrrD
MLGPDHMTSTSELARKPFAHKPLKESVSLMRITQLRGLRVISLSEALKMGAVEDILLDPTCRWIAALRVHGGGAGGKDHLVMRQAVKRVGQHAVILGAPMGVTEETNEPALDRLIDLKSFIGLEVVTDEGVLLGRIHDAEIDPQTLNILEYDLVRNFWDSYLQTGLRISAQDTLSGSKDVLIMPQASLQKRGAITESPDTPKEW